MVYELVTRLSHNICVRIVKYEHENNLQFSVFSDLVSSWKSSFLYLSDSISIINFKHPDSVEEN